MTTDTPFPANAHIENCRVTYRMSDQMGVVYYGNYLEMFEMGRSGLLRSTGFSYRQMEQEGYQLPVIHAALDYLSPARYDDLLDNPHVDRSPDPCSGRLPLSDHPERAKPGSVQGQHPPRHHRARRPPPAPFARVDGAAGITHGPRLKGHLHVPNRSNLFSQRPTPPPRGNRTGHRLVIDRPRASIINNC